MIVVMLNDVRKHIVTLCETVPTSTSLTTLLEHWQSVLRCVHHPVLEFVRPFKADHLLWPAWQLFNPVVPMLVSEIAQRWDVYEEMVVFAWSVGCLMMNGIRPFDKTSSLIENVLLDMTNLALATLPMVDRHITAVPDVVTDIFAVVGCTIPFVLMVVLLIIEHCCTEDAEFAFERDKLVTPDPLPDLSWLDVVADVIALREPTAFVDAMKLCLRIGRAGPDVAALALRPEAKVLSTHALCVWARAFAGRPVEEALAFLAEHVQRPGLPAGDEMSFQDRVRIAFLSTDDCDTFERFRRGVAIIVGATNVTKVFADRPHFFLKFLRLDDEGRHRFLDHWTDERVSHLTMSQRFRLLSRARQSTLYFVRAGRGPWRSSSGWPSHSVRTGSAAAPTRSRKTRETPKMMLRSHGSRRWGLRPR